MSSGKRNVCLSIKNGSTMNRNLKKKKNAEKYSALTGPIKKSLFLILPGSLHILDEFLFHENCKDRYINRHFYFRLLNHKNACVETVFMSGWFYASPSYIGGKRMNSHKYKVINASSQ